MQQTILTSIQIDDFRKVLSEVVSQEIQKVNQSEETPQTELITRKETAKILGVSLPTLLDWSKRGLIPSYRIGSRVRYKKTEVLDSIKEVKSLKYGRGNYEK